MPTGPTLSITATTTDRSCASANRSGRASPGGRPSCSSKRISKQDGSFGGVLTAAIDSDYFNNF